MSDANWSWWVGHEEERYHTQCETREEAVQIARDDYDGAYIIEALQDSEIQLSESFDADPFLARAEDRAFDDHGDPEGDETIFETSAEETNDLEIMVQATIKQWQEKHGLTFKGWRFLQSRNGEYVPAADEDEA